MSNTAHLIKMPMKDLENPALGKDVEHPKVYKIDRLIFVDWMRAYAILCMVFVHAAEQLPETDQNSPTWMVERKKGFMRMFCTYGVPIFFFVSGMAQSRNRRDFWKWSKSRFIRMLIPLIVVIPLLLQPMQYLACGTGHIRFFCKRYFPTDGEHIDYSTFLGNWYGHGFVVLKDLQYLWFLVALLVVDLLNYAPSKFMLCMLEGGFYGKDGKRQSTWQRLDIIIALVLHVTISLAAAWIAPAITFYIVCYLSAEVCVCAGLKLFIITKQYPVWFVTCWILPSVTILIARYWPMELVDGRQKELNGCDTLRMLFFMTYNLQGHLDQMIIPFWEKAAKKEGKNYGLYKVVRTIRVPAALFMFALASPTSGDDLLRITEVPMYIRTPPLAFLAQIATWLFLKVTTSVMRIYYNDDIDKRIFVHVAQFPIVVYLFHMPLIILSFGISDRFPPDLSFAYTYLADTSFVFCSCFLIYFLLLQTRVTRALFGLRKDFENRKVVALLKYEQISQAEENAERLEV